MLHASGQVAFLRNQVVRTGGFAGQKSTSPADDVPGAISLPFLRPSQYRQYRPDLARYRARPRDRARFGIRRAGSILFGAVSRANPLQRSLARPTARSDPEWRPVTVDRDRIVQRIRHTLDCCDLYRRPGNTVRRLRDRVEGKTCLTRHA